MDKVSHAYYNSDNTDINSGLSPDSGVKPSSVYASFKGTKDPFMDTATMDSLPVPATLDRNLG